MKADLSTIRFEKNGSRLKLYAHIDGKEYLIGGRYRTKKRAKEDLAEAKFEYTELLGGVDLVRCSK